MIVARAVLKRGTAAKAVLLFSVLFVTWQILFIVSGGSQTLNTELFSYLILSGVLAIFLILDGQTFSGLGLRRTGSWRTYLTLGIVLAAIFVSYLLIFGFLLSGNSPDGFSQPLISTVGYGVLSVPYVVMLALVVGIVEETSFRGYVLRNLRMFYSTRKAIVFSSVMFGLYHLSIPGIWMSQRSLSQTFTFWTSFMIFAFSAGLFLGYFYTNSQQTTIGTIAFHSGNILLQSFTPYTTALTFTVGSLLSSIPYLLFIPFLAYLRRRGMLGRAISETTA